jgi:hypothetical protein
MYMATTAIATEAKNSSTAEDKNATFSVAMVTVR